MTKSGYRSKQKGTIGNPFDDLYVENNISSILTATMDIGSPIKYVDKIYTRTLQFITELDIQGVMTIQDGIPIPFTNGDTTPDVSNSVLYSTANLGATLIATFDNGTDGQIIIIRFGDNNTTLAHGANIMLSGGANKNFTDGQTVMLMLNVMVWYQIGGEI